MLQGAISMNTYEYYVYAYLNENNIPYYIGKGKNKRAFAKHRVPVPLDYTKIVFLEKNLSEIGAIAIERRMIDWYGRIDLTTGILLNRNGFGGFSWTEEQRLAIKGRKVSDATKTKLRDANLGKKASTETRQKLSKIRLGKKQARCTEQGRANIKKANQGKNVGRILSEETKAKIKESNKATWAKKLLLRGGP
jgi:hypothetical protein